MAEWREAGITHVVDNRMEWSDEELVGEIDPSVRYLRNGVDDAGQAMHDWWFDEAVAFAFEALAGATASSRQRPSPLTFRFSTPTLTSRCWPGTPPCNSAEAVRRWGLRNSCPTPVVSYEHEFDQRRRAAGR